MNTTVEQLQRDFPKEVKRVRALIEEVRRLYEEEGLENARDILASIASDSIQQCVQSNDFPTPGLISTPAQWDARFRKNLLEFLRNGGQDLREVPQIQAMIDQLQKAIKGKAAIKGNDNENELDEKLFSRLIELARGDAADEKKAQTERTQARQTETESETTDESSDESSDAQTAQTEEDESDMHAQSDERPPNDESLMARLEYARQALAAKARLEDTVLPGFDGRDIFNEPVEDWPPTVQDFVLSSVRSGKQPHQAMEDLIASLATRAEQTRNDDKFTLFSINFGARNKRKADASPKTAHRFAGEAEEEGDTPANSSQQRRHQPDPALWAKENLSPEKTEPAYYAAFGGLAEQVRKKMAALSETTKNSAAPEKIDLDAWRRDFHSLLIHFERHAAALNTTEGAKAADEFAKKAGAQIKTLAGDMKKVIEANHIDPEFQKKVAEFVKKMQQDIEQFVRKVTNKIFSSIENRAAESVSNANAPHPG